MIAIIGAGPIGSYAAYLLAKAGKEVHLFEQKPVIGKPVSCTGIVTSEINKILDLPKEVVLNKVNQVVVHAPNGKIAKIRINDIVIDRTKFDQFLAKKAQKAGAKLYLKKKIKSLSELKKYKHIIDASGPKPLAIKNQYNYYTGLQARIKGDFKKDEYRVYLGNNMAPNFFAWALPESNTVARVGLATLKNPKPFFDKFIKQYFPKSKILDYQGGLIPIFDQNAALEKNNTYLIGDAASQVKASTGGGIVPGLRAAKALTNSILNKTNYKTELKSINRNLFFDKIFIRRVMNKFTDNDYNQLIEAVGKKSVQNILAKESRDNSFSLLTKLLIRNPRLLLFLKKLL
jgi:digeranylgeranylglycerophospholipid reductase